MFQGPRGLRGLQGPMGSVGDRVGAFLVRPLIAHDANISIFALTECLFLGPAWFQRQTWHRRHHWKDSESLLVHHTHETETMFGSSLQTE